MSPSTVYLIIVCCFYTVSCLNNIGLPNGVFEVSTPQSYHSKWANENMIPEAWVPVHWLDNTLVKQLGQVSGVSVDPNNDDNIYLFHRGDRVWNMNVFGRENNYLQRDLGPISTPTIIVLHSNGSVIRSWGDGLFYLPHGITVDKHNNVWVTDVALHQVMKFPPSSNSPQIVLGEQFIPGKDSRHFCKPTSVAVASNGDFFVADGYCNFRILKFNAAGVKILEWGRSVLNGISVLAAVVRPPGDNEFRIPHALTIAEDKDLLCVADRENGRVQCFNINNGTFVMSLSSPELGSRIFSVAYSPAKGGMFFIINGPKLMGNSEPVCGHVVSAFDKFKIVARFGLSLKNPHNIAVSSDGKFVYVGELEPNMAWKFVQNGTISNDESQASPHGIISVAGGHSINGLTILVIGACLVFVAAVIIAAFIYSRSKMSGYGQCSNNRWLLSNGTAEGFKLGNILGHQGFEKLNNGEESDEEQQLA